jgi:hypothetical protein
MGKILKRIILPQILVKRHTYYDQEILGTLIILGTKGEVLFSCKTLELAWRDNKRNISAVPLGTYDIVLNIHQSLIKSCGNLKVFQIDQKLKYMLLIFIDNLMVA